MSFNQTYSGSEENNLMLYYYSIVSTPNEWKRNTKVYFSSHSRYDTSFIIDFQYIFSTPHWAPSFIDINFIITTLIYLFYPLEENGQYCNHHLIYVKA